jgi:uncharacterized membrane protein YkvA (DUF1232 family)
MRTQAPGGTVDRVEYDQDVQYVLENLDRKLSTVESKLGFLKHVIALYRYMRDPQVHWMKKTLVVGALVYLIVPVDAVPDFTPLFGFVDDALVVTAAVKTIGKALAQYYD